MSPATAAVSARVLRFEVPVDDQWHEISHAGDVLAVAARDPRVVEFWAVDVGPSRPRSYRVFGTGQPLSDVVWWQGTALAGAGTLVWHLFERSMARA